MEAATTNSAQSATGVSAAANNNQPADHSAVEALRKKWRDKWARRQAKKGIPVQPAAPGGPPVAPVPAVAGQPGAPAGGQGPVPWTSLTLRPLFQTLVPTVEKVNVNKLRRVAIEISPEAVQIVEKNAGWNDAVKATLIESSSALSAKYANKLGISAEYAPEVTWAIAAGSVLASHVTITAELQKLAAEIKADREKAHQQNLSHAAA